MNITADREANHLQEDNVLPVDLIKFKKIDAEIANTLNDFQKLLLITDGTVTELLEHHLGEPIKVDKLYEKLYENIHDLPTDHRVLIDDVDTPKLQRRVRLRGKNSLKVCLYAESSILLNSLPENFKNDLIDSNTPIGNLWSKYRVETYKTDFSVKKETVNEYLAKQLNVDVNSKVISRTYCVYSQGKKTMIITEKFSTDAFTNL